MVTALLLFFWCLMIHQRTESWLVEISLRDDWSSPSLGWISSGKLLSLQVSVFDSPYSCCCSRSSRQSWFIINNVFLSSLHRFYLTLELLRKICYLLILNLSDVAAEFFRRGKWIWNSPLKSMFFHYLPSFVYWIPGQ